jgi:hypothetical protein
MRLRCETAAERQINVLKTRTTEKELFWCAPKINLDVLFPQCVFFFTYLAGVPPSTGSSGNRVNALNNQHLPIVVETERARGMLLPLW